MVAERRVIRYRFNERLMHWAASLSYLYLLFTGLAFWTPALYWMAVMLGGGYLSRLLHPWIGLAFTAVVVWMFVLWHLDMQTTPEDRAWRKAIRHYIRNEDSQVPPVWRFNDGQKVFFWVMVVGGIALLLSGLVLWVVGSVPPNLRLLRYIAVLVHAVAALVTIGGFIVHIYMGIFVVPGSVHAVVHGDVSEEWARTHHALWHARLGPEDFVPPATAKPPTTMTSDVRPRG